MFNFFYYLINAILRELQWKGISQNLIEANLMLKTVGVSINF